MSVLAWLGVEWVVTVLGLAAFLHEHAHHTLDDHKSSSRVRK
jgi:hypothetical protein